MSEKRTTSTEAHRTYPRSQENGWIGDDLRAIYIHDAKKSSMLPSEEIARLSGQVQEGIIATEALNDLNVMLNADELEQLELIKKMGHDARNEMVVANTGLVFHFASHYEGRGVEYLDLIQAGNLGLMRAAEKFDPSKGFTFATYAKTWIKSFMSTEIHWHGRTIRIQEGVSAQLQKLRRIIKENANVGGEEMTTEQMAKAMGKSEEDIIEMLEWDRKAHTIWFDSMGDEDATRGHNTAIEHSAFIADRDSYSVEDVAVDNAAQSAIVKAVRNLLAASTLDDRSKEIISMEFGLDGNKPISRTTISKKVVGNQEMISRLSDQALEQLKREAGLFGMAQLLD